MTEADSPNSFDASDDASAVSNRSGFLLEVKHTAARNATAQDNQATAHEGAVHAGRTVNKSGSSTAPGPIPSMLIHSILSVILVCMTDVTQILSQIEQGDPSAAKQHGFEA